MAIYHAAVKVFSRSAGHSGTAAAAYRLGIAIDDVSAGRKHDYTRRGGVAFTFAAAPALAPSWARDPAALWCAAEVAEKRKNSCVARELEFALPHELNPEQQQTLAQAIAAQMVERYGIAASGAIHEPDKGGKNFHCHLLMTTRRMGPDGLGEKTRELDDLGKAPDGGLSRGKQEILWVREMVAVRINAALESAGISARVDHRSLDAQQIDALSRGDLARAVELDRAPTVHEGKQKTRRSENQAIAQDNVAHQQALANLMREAEQQAAREARLMPPHDDKRPSPPIRRPNYGRPNATPLNAHSIHLARLRHRADGNQPLLSVSALHNPPIEQRGRPAELSRDLLRPDVQGHPEHRQAMHRVPADRRNGNERGQSGSHVEARQRPPQRSKKTAVALARPLSAVITERLGRADRIVAERRRRTQEASDLVSRALGYKIEAETRAKRARNKRDKENAFIQAWKSEHWIYRTLIEVGLLSWPAAIAEARLKRSQASANLKLARRAIKLQEDAVVQARRVVVRLSKRSARAEELASRLRVKYRPQPVAAPVTHAPKPSTARNEDERKIIAPRLIPPWAR